MAWKLIGIIIIVVLAASVAIYHQKYQKLQASVDRFFYAAQNASTPQEAQTAMDSFYAQSQPKQLYRESHAGLKAVFRWIFGGGSKLLDDPNPGAHVPQASPSTSGSMELDCIDYCP